MGMPSSMNHTTLSTHQDLDITQSKYLFLYFPITQIMSSFVFPRLGDNYCIHLAKLGNGNGWKRKQGFQIFSS